ncbi:hypothetical protein ACTU3I_09915 [Microbacterium sp. RD1]|uniref:hypothetical protein n=1 Tax=Microbacterium sp. RD1 TaxID=3457313 RepID=UPI003FA5D6C8
MREPLLRPGRLVTPADLRVGGIPRGVVRRRGMQHPFHGVYRVGDPAVTVVERCEALWTLLDERHCFRHLTAARLWGMPLPWLPKDSALHVLSEGARGRVRRPGVVGWETEPGGLRRAVRQGLPVVAPADVWAQLSALPRPQSWAFGLEWLVAIGDFLLTGDRAHPALCTRRDLIDAVHRRAGKRGAKLLTLALSFVRAGPQSPKESLTRMALILHGLPEPVVQLPVDTVAGRRHSDPGYPGVRLLIEYQGDHHRTSRAQWREDLTRLQLFEDAGYRTIQVTDDLWPDPRALIARIARALRENPWTHTLRT